MQIYKKQAGRSEIGFEQGAQYGYGYGGDQTSCLVRPTGYTSLATANAPTATNYIPLMSLADSSLIYFAARIRPYW